MPELPDVETYKQYLNKHALKKKIIQIRIISRSLLKDITATKFKKELLNSRFINTYRHGKYLFAEDQNQHYVVFHFGMTGSLQYGKGKVPKYTAVLFQFTNNRWLAFIAIRKFERIYLTPNLAEFINNKKLGIDALAIKFIDFAKLITTGKGGIKSWLMDQHHMAGLGNIYTDEVLFHSKIHPLEKIQNLDKENIKKLYTQIKNVLRVAIKAKAEVKNFPNSFLLPHRHPHGYCPSGHKLLKQIEVNGRTTYFCPNCQKLGRADE